MKQALLICTTLFFFQYLASAQKLDWAKSIGGIGSDYGTAMKVDNAGNVYTIGSYFNVIDADPGPGVSNLSVPGRSAFLLKQNASGIYTWAITFFSSGNCYGTGIAVSNSGSIYVCGYFDKTTDFDPGPLDNNLSPSTPGSLGGFLCKYDNNGNLIWAKYLGEGSESCINNALSFDSKGNMILAGNFKGTADLDPSPGTTFMLTSTSTTLPDGYICKVDTNGDFIWGIALSGASTKNAAAIASDTSGNVYCSGTFQGTVDFDPTGGVLNLISKGLDDIFVAKYNSSGLLSWAKSIGNTGSEKCSTIAVDKWKNIYLSGSFANTVDFDPGTPVVTMNSISPQDLFLCKLDNNANLKWAKQFQANSSAAAYVATDTLGYVYNCGDFEVTVDFDPGTKVSNLSSSGGDDIFISKYDSTGNYIWSRKIGGVSQDIVNTMVLDRSANIYLTGSFYDSCDFDPNTAVYNLKALTVNDAYIFKMNQCLIPLNKTVTLTAGVLTSAESTPTTFQWINCATKMPIAGATGKTFTVPLTGSYAVVIQKSNCIDTSECFSANGSNIFNYNEDLEGIGYYPNPGSGKIFVELGKQYESIEVHLSNILGQKISEKTFKSIEHFEYQFEGPSGIYLMEIKTNDGISKTLKLVKE